MIKQLFQVVLTPAEQQGNICSRAKNVMIK